MDLKNNKIIYSPTDLVKFIESPYVSWLDHYCIENPKYKEKQVSSKLRDELFNLGNLLEAQYYRKIEKLHYKKVKTGDKSLRETIFALNSGYKFIAQAHLKKDNFEGFADLLTREKGKSKLGNYHYTVKDIKRASVPKAKFIIQICCYLEMLEKIQGYVPETAGIILGPYNEESFVVKDFYDYYLNIKDLFLDFHNSYEPKLKPIPSLMESLGDWEDEAVSFLEKKDSLLLLPSIDTEDIKKLQEQKIDSRDKLIKKEDIKELSDDSIAMYKEEAKVQKNNLKYTLFEHKETEPKGLFNLPQLSDNDIIIDIRNSDSYHKDELFYSFSIFNMKGELENTFCFRKDYERGYIYKFLKSLKTKAKDCNIFFFGTRVLDSLKEAASSQGVFLESLEEMIFNRKLIDLQLILKQGIAIPYYNYNLENTAKILNNHDFEDNFGLLFNFLFHANKDDKEEYKEKLNNQQVEYFNLIKDIIKWLNKLQEENKLNFIPYSRRLELDEVEEDSESEDSFEYNFNLEKYNEATSEDKVGILLKQLINFYKNEKRPKELDTINLLNQEEVKLEKSTRALSFLRYIDNPIEDKNYIRRYSFYKNQEFKLSEGDRVILHQNPSVSATIKSIDVENSQIILQFTKKQVSWIEKFRKLTIIENNMVPSRSLEQSVLKTALSVDKEKDYLGLNKCLFDFLLKNYPDIEGVRKGDALYSEKEDLIDASIRVVNKMNNSCIIFQGPPGAGKTYTTTKIVYDLLLKNKKIAISSNSHKAINNVLNRLIEENPAINIAKIGGKREDLEDGIRHLSGAKGIDNSFNVLGGTAFSLCHDDLNNKIDYLFIDEAGQVSIPNLIAMSRCCKNIILIGDQMQLEQPLQAIHPGDSGLSCLEYYLGDKKTIPDNLGFFLPITRRMNSELCKVISDNFYEGKLLSHESAEERFINLEERHKLVTKKKGFQFIKANHKFNKQYSIEELDIIDNLRQELLGSKLSFDGTDRILEEKDIIYVSPYNMQVKKMRERWGDEIQAGSVDLFQGQEAPIVIISLASSDSSSRGLEFLLSENRLNVAISRGQALAILIGNVDILRSSANSLKELKLLNLFSNLIK